MWWRGRDSNPRSCAQLIYSQPPLAAWVPLRAGRGCTVPWHIPGRLQYTEGVPILSSPWLQVVAAVLGLSAGSIIVFVSPYLVAHRLPEAPPYPPRRVLIPLSGVWWTGWRPRYNTVVELTLAVIFVGLTFRFGDSLRLLLAGVYSMILATIAYIDLDHRLVLNRLSYPSIVLALVLSPLWPGLGLATAAAGAAVGLVIFAALQLAGRGALGTGDTKLAVLIGAMRGFPAVFSALVLGMILGGLAAIYLLAVLRRGRKEYIAYAPYLALGAILSFFLTGP